jgi:hypothetical protein
MSELSQASIDVLDERRRQVEAEGWTQEHDDKHGRGEMAIAAGWYALSSPYVGRRECVGVNKGEAAQLFHNEYGAYAWPFSLSWWKPTDQRRDLVKACALIIAEIERLDRAKATA